MLHPLTAMNSVQHVANYAESGSPVLLRSVAKLWGLGDAEVDAAVNGCGLPNWSVAVVAGLTGVVVGAYLAQRYPKLVSKVI